MSAEVERIVERLVNGWITEAFAGTGSLPAQVRPLVEALSRVLACCGGSAQAASSRGGTLNRQQRWQAKKIAEGFCATCGHRVRRDGRRECSVCSFKAWRRRRMARKALTDRQARG